MPFNTHARRPISNQAGFFPSGVIFVRLSFLRIIEQFVLRATKVIKGDAATSRYLWVEFKGNVSLHLLRPNSGYLSF